MLPDALSPGRRALAFLTMAVVACARDESRDDGAGTAYVVSGALSVSPVDGGMPAHSTIAGETVTVRLASRHYQNGEYEVTVRGCTLRGSAPLPGAAFGISAPRCTFAGLGDITANAGSDVLRRNSEIELNVFGSSASDGASASLFHYTVHGVLKR